MNPKSEGIKGQQFSFIFVNNLVKFLISRKRKTIYLLKQNKGSSQASVNQVASHHIVFYSVVFQTSAIFKKSYI